MPRSKHAAELNEIDQLFADLEKVPDELTGGDPDAVDAEAEPDFPEPEVEAEQEPEPVATAPLPQAPAAQPQVMQEQRTVPYDAMFAERARRQELERERQELIAERERMRGEVNSLREMFQSELSRREEAKKAQEAEAAKPKKLDLLPLPDWNEDPAAHVKALHENHRREQVNLRIEMEERARAEAERLNSIDKTVKETVEQYQTRLKQQEEYQNLVNHVTTRERSFAVQAPDYYDAIQHYKQELVQDYVAMGATPEVAMNVVAQKMHADAAGYVQAGLDPAQSWYALAVRRGWNSAQPQQPAGGMAAPVNGTGNGHAAPPAAPQRQAGRPSVSTMQRGMQSGQGLAAVAGAGGGIAPDPARAIEDFIDKASDAQLYEYMRGSKKDQFEKMLERAGIKG